MDDVKVKGNPLRKATAVREAVYLEWCKQTGSKSLIDYLLAVVAGQVRDEEDKAPTLRLRVDTAFKLMPYLHKKLPTEMQITGDKDNPIAFSVHKSGGNPVPIDTAIADAKDTANNQRIEGSQKKLNEKFNQYFRK